MSERSPGDRIWYGKWPSQVPKCLDYPDCSLSDFLKESALKHGPNVAINFLGSTITYDQLWDLVRRLATGLSRLGLKKGDVCSLMLPNSHQYVVSYYACHLLGITVAAINPTYKALEIQHQLMDSGAKALIILDAVFDEASRGLKGTRVEHVIGTNIVDLCDFSALKRFLGRLLKKIPSGEMPVDALKFTELIKTEPQPPAVEIDAANDIALLQYTGGTTGMPKGAMLTHRNVVANAVQCDAWLWKRKPGMGVIGVLPLFHSYAMTTVMNVTIHIGGFQLLFPRPPADMAELFATIQKYSPKGGFIMPGVATLFNKINTHPKVKDYDLGSLTMAISGAGPLPLEVQNRFEELTGSIIVEGYGLSEASPVTHANPIDKDIRRLGTIGLPYPDTDIKIMDRETGENELPPLPFAVAQTGGLSPEQAVEADKYTGELVVKAFIVLDPAKRGQVTAEDIRTWARNKITWYKIPTVIEFREELPTTMVGKVLRRVLKEEKLAKGKRDEKRVG